MRINSIKLKNYRVHKNLEIEFTEGINLLLGKNGAGKSSVLEAIGIAMFGVNGRTKIDDIIKRGEKIADIEVEFVGNDKVEYVVCKKLGRSLHTLQKKDNSQEKISESKEVVKQVKKLCGIREESDKIYESVITASQNRLVDIFLIRDTDKEKVFDEIFDTKIYRRMYEGYSKIAWSKYKDSIIREEGKLEGLKNNLGDILSIKSDLELNKKQLEESYIKRDKLKNEIEALEIKKDEVEKLSQKIKSIDRDIISKKEIIENRKKVLKELKREIENSKKSKDLVEKNSIGYKSYIEVNKELEGKEKELTLLRNIKDEETILKEKRSKVGNRIIELESEIKNSKKNLEDKYNFKNEIKNSINEKESEFVILQKKSDNLNSEIKDIEVKIEIIDETVSKRDANVEKVKILKQKREDFNKDNFNKDDFNKSLKDLETELKSLDKKEDEIKDIRNRVAKIDALIEQNNEAKVNLSGGECPYLGEKCKNISDGDLESEKYFIEKEKKLFEEKRVMESNLENYEGNSENIKNAERKKVLLKQERDHYLESEKNYKENGLKIEGIEKDIKIIELKLSGKLGVEILDIKSFLEELKNSNIKKKTELDLIELDKFREDLENEIVKTNKLKEEISEIEKSLEKFTLDLLKSKEESSDLLKEIDGKSVILKDFDAKVECVNSLKNRRSDFGNSYDIYIKNIKESEKLDELFLKESEEAKLIDDNNENLNLKEVEYLQLKKSYSAEEYETLLDNFGELKKKMEEVVKLLGTLEESVKNSEKSYLEYKKSEEGIKELKKVIKKLVSKLKLCDMFRENIKSMGKQVANYMLREIEIKATENFREITGRAEEVEWKNSVKESYAVYLSDGVESRSFAMLSGGEQVAVAISIRSALSATLSNAKFSIFDEPTNNLDDERRKSLADSLNIVLKGIEQSIIVTHDDTFREMAENIVVI